MKTNKRTGFTLVELLVVISIIAVLAGLLMPAIQAAREAARRAQCISNQRQVAFAVLNYDHTRGSIPALRAPMKPSAYPCRHFSGYAIGDINAVETELTWVGFLLPFMEHSPAWGQLSASGKPGDSIVDRTVYDFVIPVMQCGSGGIAPGESRISYVANAGPLNTVESNEPFEFGRARLDCRNVSDIERMARMDTLFFDHFASVGPWRALPGDPRLEQGPPNGPVCKTKITVDNIASMDGTSMTIMLSENEEAGRWIWYFGTDSDIPRASLHNAGGTVTPNDNIAEVEYLIGFCYPNEEEDNYTVGFSGRLENPVYRPLMVPGPDTNMNPLFINEGRNSNVDIIEPTRTARPSSGHPSVVIAAFCDGGVRPLKDDMDKLIFVQLSRPGSAVVLNPKDVF